jgi:hypothetical protein
MKKEDAFMDIFLKLYCSVILTPEYGSGSSAQEETIGFLKSSIGDCYIKFILIQKCPFYASFLRNYKFKILKVPLDLTEYLVL